MEDNKKFIVCGVSVSKVGGEYKYILGRFEKFSDAYKKEKELSDKKKYEIILNDESELRIAKNYKILVDKNKVIFNYYDIFVEEEYNFYDFTCEEVALWIEYKNETICFSIDNFYYHIGINDDGTIRVIDCSYEDSVSIELAFANSFQTIEEAIEAVKKEFKDIAERLLEASSENGIVSFEDNDLY